MRRLQYYEFQASERLLTELDRKFLRLLSSYVLVTSRSLNNICEWRDFNGDPAKLLERCVDLLLYWDNCGGHRLVVSLPARLLDRTVLERCIGDDGAAELHKAGANVVLDIHSDDDEGGSEKWDENREEDGVAL